MTKKGWIACFALVVGTASLVLSCVYAPNENSGNEYRVYFALLLIFGLVEAIFGVIMVIFALSDFTSRAKTIHQQVQNFSQLKKRVGSSLEKQNGLADEYLDVLNGLVRRFDGNVQTYFEALSLKDFKGCDRAVSFGYDLHRLYKRLGVLVELVNQLKVHLFLHEMTGQLRDYLSDQLNKRYEGILVGLKKSALPESEYTEYRILLEQAQKRFLELDTETFCAKVFLEFWKLSEEIAVLIYKVPRVGIHFRDLRHDEGLDAAVEFLAGFEDFYAWYAESKSESDAGDPQKDLEELNSMLEDWLATDRKNDFELTSRSRELHIKANELKNWLLTYHTVNPADKKSQELVDFSKLLLAQEQVEKILDAEMDNDLITDMRDKCLERTRAKLLIALLECSKYGKPIISADFDVDELLAQVQKTKDLFCGQKSES